MIKEVDNYRIHATTSIDPAIKQRRYPNTNRQQTEQYQTGFS